MVDACSHRALPDGEVVVVGVGARAPNGLTALQITMSVRALRMDPIPSQLVDRAGEPMATCRLASIPDHVMGIDRFVALAGPALSQASFDWARAERARTGRVPPLPVVVALPDRGRPGFDPRLEEHLLPALEAQSHVALDRERSSLIFGCRGGGVAAFAKARDLLASGACEAVAVGGVDSYFDPLVLEWLDRERRLHSMETENGFIPGEGAGFVVLARGRTAASIGGFARILGIGTALEPRPYGSAEPCMALGITLAVKHAVQEVGTHAGRIPWAMTDVANERHRVDEWMAVMARHHRALTADAIHDQPLLRTGDLGAASASVLLCIAATRWQTGAAPGDAVLIATHSDGAERGALVASGPTARGRERASSRTSPARS